MLAVGRPKALTKEDVLSAIRRWKTTSPYELAEKLNVSHMTIYRRLENIPKEEIAKIFEDLAESELKPAEIESYKVFVHISIVAEYRKKLLNNIRVSQGVARRRCRSLWHICRVLKRHPQNLTVKECADLISRIRRQEILITTTRGRQVMGLTNAKKTMRSWFAIMQKVNPNHLTAEGIDAEETRGTGRRARARLTREQRQAFMRVLKEKVEANWEGNMGSWKVRIPFGDEPHLALRMLVLPKAYYYWGNRKNAVLKARIENMEWSEPCSVQILVDKGLHRKGRRTWEKHTTGELLQLLTELWEAIGKPKEGKWFPFTGTQATTLFKECYVEAGILEKRWEGMPIHIWRHTACQDMLDATNYNYEMTAELLSWESVETMKKHYGRLARRPLQKVLMKAMGMKVQRTRPRFEF